jgi:hypothetical protein
VLAVAESDARAVIQLEGDTPLTLSAGDAFANDRYTLSSVRSDHVVLRERTAAGGLAEIWVWVVDEHGRSRSRRIDRSPGPTPRVRKSEVQTLKR